MTADAEDWLAGRERLRAALSSLAEAGRELDIASAERRLWRSAAAALADPLLVLLAGPESAGARRLAGALSGEELERSAGSEELPLTIWKYGFEVGEMIDGPVLECYRPVPKLAGCEFAEFSARGLAEGGELAERAYAMCDLVLLVFSASDPWGRDPWEFVRQLHRRRRRPAAAVLTDVEQRSEEEVEALLEHLRSTADSALSESLPAFAVGVGEAGADTDGVRRLGAWISGAASQRPSARDRRAKAEDLLGAAAERTRRALSAAADDSEGEADCIRWIDAQIVREREAAGQDSAERFARAAEVHRESGERARRRLKKMLRLPGALASLLRGGRWLLSSREQAAEEAGRVAEDAARRVAEGVEKSLGSLRRRIEERARGVFGAPAGEALHGTADTPAPLAGEELARRFGARARETSGSAEAGRPVAAMLGGWRLLLWAVVLAVGGGLAATWWLAGRDRLSMAAIAGGSSAVALLWGIIFLRARGRSILQRYDAGSRSASEAIGAQLERACKPELDRVFQHFSDRLAGIRKLAAERARQRDEARMRVKDAIALAAELQDPDEAAPYKPVRAIAKSGL